MVAGVVFDMDGTLVDTEHVHFDAWNTVFGQFGVGPFDAEWFDQWIGRSAPSLGAQMVEDYEQIAIDAAELVARKEVSSARFQYLSAVTLAFRNPRGLES
jgi:beta-phosphoglucomutase